MFPYYGLGKKDLQIKEANMIELVAHLVMLISELLVIIGKSING